MGSDPTGSMLDTYQTISIFMFFADHKETRERRLSFCKSLTVNASIGNADKNACCWLKLIRYSLSVCALDRVSSAVLHCKSTGNEVSANVCMSYCIISASYLVATLTSSWWFLWIFFLIYLKSNPLLRDPTRKRITGPIDHIGLSIVLVIAERVG